MGSTARDTVTPGHPIDSARPGVWLTDLALLAMALIWGVNFSVVKYGTALIDPLAYNGMRVALAAAVLCGVVALGRSDLPRPRTIAALMGLGVLGNGLYQLLFVEGVAHTSASDAALVIAASPGFIAIIGQWRGVDRIRARGALGIAMSIGGIALVVAATARASGGTASAFGDLLMVLAALAWSIYTVLLKPHTERVSGMQLAAFTMLGGAIPLLVVAAPAIARTHWTALPVLGWGALVYSGVGSLVIAYSFWYRGIRVLGPTRTAMYSNLQPVLGLLMAWVLLHEFPTAWQGIGTVLIVGGLLLTRA